MKLIIDIPEEDYKHGMLGLYFDCYSMKLHETILNGTPIPDNATNEIEAIIRRYTDEQTN